MCCIVSSRPWMYEDWLIHLTMTTSSASAFKTLDEVYLTVHRQSAVIFSCYSVLSVLYLHRLTFWCVSWLSTTDQSLPLFEDRWDKVGDFVAVWLLTDEKGQQVFWFQNDWQWKTVRLCLFFFKACGFSVELHWKSFALKQKVWEQGLVSPTP